MYPLLYFILFYAIALVGLLVVFVILLASGFFSSAPKEPKKPLTTLDFLIEQVQHSKADKAIMDGVMKEFYANFYRNYKGAENLNAWLALIQSITMLEYMSMEQAAQFRDDLASKNPSIKKEIEHSIGISLKYRKANQKKG
ncbi:hypothetical protein ACWIUD_09840 [Helicobacter sp. 23-1044]